MTTPYDAGFKHGSNGGEMARPQDIKPSVVREKFNAGVAESRK